MARKRANKSKAANGTMVVAQKVPLATSFTAKRPEPKVSLKSDGRMTISHTEYVGDVLSALLPISYRVNPQDGRTFTWLSAIATRFEMYKFSHLKFMYRPSCPTTTSGSVIIGLDTDSYDAQPDKLSMLAWQMAGRGAPWQDIVVDCSKNVSKMTARFNDTSIVGDSRTSDLGNFWVLTPNYSALDIYLGEVFVEYTVEFLQPSYKIPPANYFYFRSDGVNTSEPFTGSKLLFSNATREGNMLVDWVTPDTIRVKTPGKYLVEYDYVVTGALTALTGIAYSGGTGTRYEVSNVARIANPATSDSVVVDVLDFITGQILIQVLNYATGTLTNKLRISTFKP